MPRQSESLFCTPRLESVCLMSPSTCSVLLEANKVLYHARAVQKRLPRLRRITGEGGSNTWLILLRSKRVQDTRRVCY